MASIRELQAAVLAAAQEYDQEMAQVEAQLDEKLYDLTDAVRILLEALGEEDVDSVLDSFPWASSVLPWGMDSMEWEMSEWLDIPRDVDASEAPEVLVYRVGGS